jgi:hypothetical protein
MVYQSHGLLYVYPLVVNVILHPIPDLFTPRIFTSSCRVSVLAPDLIRLLTKSKMSPTRPFVIHELLPNEIMGVIFEEHTKLEWRAPTIDGRVCRLWRQIVLNTPRAWIYLEISDGGPPRTTELAEWLHRSGSAPLYIRIRARYTFDVYLDRLPWQDLLYGHCTRIASLRLPANRLLFFDRREFPCLRLLEIYQHDYILFPPCTMRWDSMPELRSLRLAYNAEKSLQLQWSELTQLKALSLYSIRLTSPPQHHQSLTTLVLGRVSIEDISSPISFPSLTYLSLYAVAGLKPYINAPCLATYHEQGTKESFSSPVPSLVEYGVLCSRNLDEDPASWHRSFPNMSRLSIRAYSPTLISFCRSLSRDPHSLPALQTICMRVLDGPFPEKEQAVIRDLVRVRGKACRMDIILYFDTRRPYQYPIFFGKVSHRLLYDLCVSNPYSRIRNLLIEGRQALAWHINPPRTCTQDACQDCHRATYHSRMRRHDLCWKDRIYNLFASSFDHIFLVDPAFNVFICGINVERLGTVHSSECQTTESILRSSQQVPRFLVVEASRCTGYVPQCSSSDNQSACLLLV